MAATRMRERWGRCIRVASVQVDADVLCLQEIEVAECAPAPTGQPHRALLPLLELEQWCVDRTTSCLIFEVTSVRRQDELTQFMADHGYAFASQDRDGSHFSITNVTFCRTSKLRLTWSESRSRALLVELEFGSGAGAPDSVAHPSAAATASPPDGDGARNRSAGGQSAADRDADTSAGAGASDKSSKEQAMAPQEQVGASAADARQSLAAAQSTGSSSSQPEDNQEDTNNAAQLTDTPDCPGRATSDSCAARRVYVVNVHLEGHPYRAKERLSQVSSALRRLQLRIEKQGEDCENAHVLLVGAPCSFMLRLHRCATLLLHVLATQTLSAQQCMPVARQRQCMPRKHTPLVHAYQLRANAACPTANGGPCR
jgi:hypothetical protein